MNTRAILIASFAVTFLVQCASTIDEPFEGDRDLAVLLGNQSGCRLSASDSPTSGAHGKVRLASASMAAKTYGDLYTGKSLTIDQLLRNVSKAFAGASTAPAGSNLYTLGSLSAGGEARFAATGDGGLTIEYLGNSTGTVSFNRDEAAIFKGLIDQALAQ